MASSKFSESKTKADLHIHSSASDGTFTPGEIVEMASRLGLYAISITDHDTTQGVKSAVLSGMPSCLRFITGVEISAASPSFYPCRGSFHILGYHIDPYNTGLNKELMLLQQARKERNPKIIRLLNELGFDMDLDEVEKLSGKGQTGRPHIAGAMVQKGFVKSIDEAFKKYLKPGRPAYVDKYRISCEDAINTIKQAGGIAVLAHPGLLRPVKEVSFEQLIKNLVETGIGGIEVFYPEHSEKQTSIFMDMAKKYSLFVTGGSDFHGSIKPDIKLGGGKNFYVPCEMVKDLINFK